MILEIFQQVLSLDNQELKRSLSFEEKLLYYFLSHLILAINLQMYIANIEVFTGGNGGGIFWFL